MPERRLLVLSGLLVLSWICACLCSAIVVGCVEASLTTSTMLSRWPKVGSTRCRILDPRALLATLRKELVGLYPVR